MINRLTASLDFHGKALALRAERQTLISGNIANADTPQYLARDFNFADALRDATSAGGSAAGIGRGNVGTGVPAPRLNYATPSQSSIDGNSVDMDRERAAFIDNSIKYETTLRFINSSVRTTLEAMKGHNQS